MTTKPLQLGVHLGQQNATMAELRQLWTRLDDVVDWISLWDHLYEAPYTGGTTPHFEAVATLGAMASATKKARLGCLVFCVPYRNPALLAKSIIAIDHIAEGRFEPGFGAGWHEPEFVAHGYSFDSLGTRFAMLEEGLEIINGMFSADDTTTFNGKHYRVQDVRTVPGPSHGPIKMWSGGSGPKRTPELAARYCAGWNVPYVSPEKYRSLNEGLDRACEAIGRDPSTLERSINLAFHIGATPAAAEAELGRIKAQWQTPGMVDRITAGALTGTADRALDRIAEYRVAGADLINIALRLPVDDSALETYLTDVIPAARHI